jgi:hypothetical protein
MTEHTASRTLVKSAPELWAECSDAGALTRHLDHFGEITITRLEPETAVAWEGEQVRGTVRLEPSGWGTKVTLTAELEAVAGAQAPELVAEPEPVEPLGPPSVAPAPPGPEPDPEPAKRPGMFARLLAMLVGKPEPEPEIVLRALIAEPEPEPVAEPEPAPAPEPEAPSLSVELANAESALVAALDSLGQAHHRPFSRG